MRFCKDIKTMLRSIAVTNDENQTNLKRKSTETDRSALISWSNRHSE